MPLHNQILVNGYSTNPIVKDEGFIHKWMIDLVSDIGMKIIQGPYVSYVKKEGNRGLTCVVMIETSHIALHIWDEPDPAQIQFDLYTCSTLPVGKVLKNLEEKLGLEKYNYLVLERSKGFEIVKNSRGGFPIDNQYK